MRALPSRLGPKINLSLLLFMLVLAAVVAGLVLFGFRRTQHNATQRSEQGLEAQGRDTLLANAGAQAYIGESQFAATGGMGREAANYMIDIRARGGSIPWDSGVLARAIDGTLYDPRPGRRTDVRVPPGVAAGAVEQDLRDSAALDAVFPTLLANVGGTARDANFGAFSAYFASASGITRYYPRAGGGIRAAPSAGGDVGPAANPERATIWSKPYQDPTGPGLIVTASTPVYDGDLYRGYIGVDLSLQRLIEQINQVKPTASGFAFFMDGDGSILRTAAFDEVRAASDDRANAGFQRALDAMRRGQTGVDRVTLAGRDMFVAYAPVTEVGASFALAAPIDEVTQQSAAVNAAIARSGNQTLTFTLVTMGLLFMLALAGAAWLNRRAILRPISSLVKGTQAVAGGDLDTRIPVTSLDEFGMLADSFNQMTQQLAHRRDALREEIEERERTSEALRASESTYRTMARNFPNGIVTVFDRDLRFLLADGSGLAEAGATPVDMVGKTIYELFSPRMVATLEPGYRAALAGETRSFELPVRGRVYRVYTVPLRTEEGEILSGMAMTQDVTETVETERVLEQRVADRTRELSTLLDVARSASSTLALQPLLTLVLEQVKRVVHYDDGGFLLHEGDELVIVATDSSNPLDAAAMSQLRLPINEQDLLWTRIAAGEPIVIDDMEDDTPETRAYRAALRGRIGRTEATVRSWLGVPLRAKERVSGMLAVSSAKPSFFTRRDAELASAIASQAAFAIENARLFEQEETRSRELRTLLDASSRVASTIELDPLLAIIFEQVRTAAPYDRASFMLRDGDRLHVRAIDLPGGDDEAPHRAARFIVRDGEPLWDAMKHGAPVVIDDIRGASPMALAYQQAVGDRLDTIFAKNRSWLGVPLMLQERVIGMLALATERPGAFDGRQAALTTAIARQAAFAIENARLFEEAQRRTRELATLLEVTRHVGSTLELMPLAHRILEETHEVVDYDRSTFMLAEGQKLRAIAVVSADGQPDATLLGIVGEEYPFGGPPLIWDRLAAGDPVIVDDTRGESELSRAYREITGERHVARSKSRSWLAVPLVAQGRLNGLMLMTKRTPAFFTPHDGELALAIARQAGAGLENARLFEEAQRRTRELTALLDVSTSVASTLDLDPLLATLLEQVSGVVEYDRAAFGLIDGNELEIVAVRAANGPPDALLRGQVGLRWRADDGGLLWESVRARKPVIINDVRDDSAQARAYREMAGDRDIERVPVRSWMSVPLESKGRVIGLLALASAEAGCYSARDARLAGAVASQAAIGIENARLFQQTEQRTRELSTVVGVSHAVASTLELRQLVTLILDQLQDVTQYTGASLLMLDGQDLVMLESRGAGRDAADLSGTRFSTAPQGLWWDALTRGGSLIIDDVRGDSAPARAYRDALTPYLDQPLFARVRSWLAVSLVAQDRPVGLLTMSRSTPAYFTEEQARIAVAIADQAALAIENARLYERVQTTAALEERQRLARELHDSVSQALYGIGLGARTARTMLDRDPARATEPLEYVLSLAEAGLTEMRALIFELRPESLATEGLVAALDKQVSATRARYGVAVEAALGEEPDAALEAKEAVYRIAQEALHNTVKHARATDVLLRLSSENGSIELEVRDNGIGFDADGEFPGHLGLRSMRERVERVRGTLRITSAPGEGTRICASIPVR